MPCFGGLVRAYGELVINGGVYTGNYEKGNGLFTCYGKTTINDCEVTNNDTANVGIFQICNIDDIYTEVNGGLYEGNTSAKRAAVFNTYAKGMFVLNGGTFRNNTVYAEGAGGAIYIVSDNAINGGVFENNVSCDFFIDRSPFQKSTNSGSFQNPVAKKSTTRSSFPVLRSKMRSTSGLTPVPIPSRE